ncbi:nucleotide sugar dehydrogenase [Macrococcus armenti]|nr:nucleotide sugar dehydrogenase [Macrococcus armenti]UBH09359.1 nucleotide sugar dehydrogenase [Macrococcus armenti]
MNRKIAVIGLGYVGLPLLNALSNKFNVIGFDIDKEKVDKYKKGIDVTGEIGENVEKLKDKLSYDIEDIREANFYIVTVPTPINSDKTPDLLPVISATKMLSKIIKKGDIVVYESTVYPGTTEEVCKPILEESGLLYNRDFYLGYSPERINPGDKINTIDKIIKIVSGSNEEVLNIIDDIYSKIIVAGTFRASSIKVAEAAKVVENTQRDINIAFMNEIATVFDKMDISTNEVLEAAGTKWNFLNFKPGLVGGHCIGVDPYYFIYKAEQLGYRSQLITNARKINEEITDYIKEKAVKMIMKNSDDIKCVKVAIFGLAFKKNVPDIRNSKIFDVIDKLIDYGFEIKLFDSVVDPKEIEEEYNLEISDSQNFEKYDLVILNNIHDSMTDEIYKLISKNENFVNTPQVIDVTSFLNKKEYPQYNIWSL